MYVLYKTLKLLCIDLIFFLLFFSRICLLVLIVLKAVVNVVAVEVVRMKILRTGMKM